jgi:hypothetical protein
MVRKENKREIYKSSYSTTSSDYLVQVCDTGIDAKADRLGMMS